MNFGGGEGEGYKHLVYSRDNQFTFLLTHHHSKLNEWIY